MNVLNCEWLCQQAFLNCYPVKTISGQQGIAVQTYHRWLDGSILNFYITPQGNQLLISDEGETLFHLSNVGLLKAKYQWRLFKDKLQSTNSDIHLEDDGEIICLTTPQSAPYAIADYLSALCAIMHYEKELAGIPEAVIDFSEEVEFYLRAWKPQATLIKKPKISGISGHEYIFDFQLEQDLIMAISPSPNAVGSAMRKAGDVLSGSFLDDRHILIIVDDRSDDLFQKKAEEEIKIISTLAKAVPFSNLQSLINKQSPATTKN
ncbi:DUF1828 domain-containing protein [Muribacter muris]|uniref:DUF1828 domain-containing protein n=1 Tax=Muribacter muris TaxID=67855 RepID=A0A4Y9K1P0_9PAST|nr:DUF1828 domain-containing protein [Muribacter muris]MBF0784470.1 DUF1828 domain-containing protein [Muribacter muris]MBF0826234.1 DUF1828 domain-containing protein [Muribacter muris]TFV11984.1 DUF1828 domain-containing protein [Muribacter muris]